jgi:hypothetical protein
MFFVLYNGDYMWPFPGKIRNSSEAFKAAVKAGTLVDMQRRPFTRYNKQIEVYHPIAMTPAAYSSFILVPGDTPIDNTLKYMRWHSVFRRFFSAAKEMHKSGEIDEDSEAFVYEVVIFRPSGFQQTLPIKVSMVHEDDSPILLFMLPLEECPLPMRAG